MAKLYGFTTGECTLVCLFWSIAYSLVLFILQWSEAKVWGNLETCEVNVNGIPGCSWHGNLVVSEEGRAMAARLLSQLTDKQITDLFTAARANLMRGDSIDDWITGFKAKLQSDIFNVQCGK